MARRSNRSRTRVSFGALERALLLASIALLPVKANAQTWSGTALSTDWNTASNWTPATVPTAADDVTMNTVQEGATLDGGPDGATNNFTLGDGAIGFLLIDNGLTLDIAGNAVFGVGADGDGRTRVFDSTFNVGGTLTLGSGGDGQLTIFTNSSATVTGETIVGDLADSFGTLSVLGPSGTFTGSTLRVGTSADSFGSAGAFNGGFIDINGLTVLGEAAGSEGDLSLDSGGIFETSSLVIGDAGLSVVTIGNGGILTSTGGIAIGDQGAGSGTVLMYGAGSQFNGSGLTVGGFGEGTLDISDGAAASVIGIFIGADDDTVLGRGFGEIRVSGAGSTLDAVGIFVGNEGSATLAVSDGGVVTAVGILIAAQATSDGFVIIGGEDPLTPQAPGTLATPTVTFGDGLGLLGFNHTSNAYTFAPAISGEGFIQAIAGTTILTADNSAFGGVAMAAFDGVLQVDDALGGDTIVGLFAPGGRIQGTGSFFNLGAIDSGVIAPGNSIGTMTVAGSLIFDIDGIYEVEVDALGASDQIIATGTADLFGGAVRVLAATGAYAPGTTYTIIDAPNGDLTGEFDSVTANTFLLRPTLSYDYALGDVLLTLTPVTFSTPNQNAVAQSLITIGGGDVFDALLGGSASDIDQFSGEVHASLLGLNLLDTQFAFDLLRSRLTGVAEAPSLVQLASFDKIVPATGAPARTFWAQPFGAWGSLDGDGNAAGLDYSRAGVSLGGDTGVGADGRIGAAFTYAQTEADVDARRSSADIDSYSLTAYGGTTLGSLNATGAVGYSWRSIGTERRAAVGPLDQRLRADYDASAWSAQAELAYPFSWRDMEMETFAGLTYVNAESEGFTEQGGSAALTSPGGDADLLISTMGLRGAHTFDDDKGALFGSLAWRHAEGDTVPDMRMAFVTSPGVAFNIAGAPLSDNAAAIEAGLRRVLQPGLTLTASYRGDIGADASEHGAALRLAWKH